MANWRQPWGQAYNRATVYLPVALMAVLALATYWLIHSTPSLMSASPSRPVRHIADYSLQDFTISTYAPEGRLLHRLSGQSAHHFPDSDTLEIETVRVKSFPSPTRITQASADKALSNRDGSDVRLMGNAVISNEDTDKPNPPWILEGEALEIFSNQQRLQSDLPVVLKQGKNQFTGDRLHYDHLSSVVELQGRVHGTLQATPTTKKAP